MELAVWRLSQPELETPSPTGQPRSPPLGLSLHDRKRSLRLRQQPGRWPGARLSLPHFPEAGSLPSTISWDPALANSALSARPARRVLGLYLRLKNSSSPASCLVKAPSPHLRYWSAEPSLREEAGTGALPRF